MWLYQVPTMLLLTTLPWLTPPAADMEELRDPAKTGELRGTACADQDRAAHITIAHMPE